MSKTTWFVTHPVVFMGLMTKWFMATSRDHDDEVIEHVASGGIRVVRS